jgi:hypothetical protein
MIDETGHPTGHLAIPLKEETTMLKTISAALLAASVLAAPALAAGLDKTTQAPASKIEQVKTSAPKADAKKTSALNANATMGRHHHRHHRSHKHMGALKTRQFSKATIKHIAPATKRG